MTSPILAALVGFGLAFSLAGTAQAQIRLDRPVGSGGPQPTAQPSGVMATITSDQLIRILGDVGYKSAQKVDTKNKNRAVRFDFNGTPVLLYLSNCEGEACSLLAYNVFLGKQDVSASFINAYNREKSWGKLYLDKDGDVTLAMELFSIGGVSPGWLAATGAIFGGVVLKGLLEFKPE